MKDIVIQFVAGDIRVILAFRMSITAYKVAFTIPTNFKSQGSFRTAADIANTHKRMLLSTNMNDYIVGLPISET